VRLPRLVIGEPPPGLDLLRVESHDDPALLTEFSCRGADVAVIAPHLPLGAKPGHSLTSTFVRGKVSPRP